MKRLTAAALLTCAIVAVSVGIPRDASGMGESYMELLRSDIKTETVAILTEVMELSDEEGTVFWPIFREYQLEKSKLGDRRIAQLRKYAENFDALTDDLAKDVADAYFKLENDQLKLEKKYFKKMDKALGANTAARFIQTMNHIGLLIDVQIAANTPLIEKVEVKEASR